MEVTEKKFGVSATMSKFLLPLGASINMNGAAIMQGVGIIFISHICHVYLSFQYYFYSDIYCYWLVGAAGVPSGATIMLTFILLMVEIPDGGLTELSICAGL